MSDKLEIQGKIEGILFAIGESLAIKDIAEALGEKESLIKEVIDDMKTFYATKDFEYRFVSTNEKKKAIMDKDAESDRL